jgi:hypothetical protein
MRIGLDFDNTIVCYDKAIKLLAEEILVLPKGLARTKLSLRSFLRAAGRESEWSTFQGELYGPGMRYAKPYEGSIRAMKELVDSGYELAIVSHRSKRPYVGKPHDLHAAAKSWIHKELGGHGLFTDEDSSASFLVTQEEKIAHIAKLECDFFLDDLPEVLFAQDFPGTTVGINFDPWGAEVGRRELLRISHWNELVEIIRRFN